MSTFGIIGISGYIAERHLKAIKSVGGEVTHIYDINNSCGIIDRYFPNAIFSENEEDFFNSKIDYKVILTPNHLHSLHTLKAISGGSKVICEKPVSLNTKELSHLSDSSKHINCILQLRYNEVVNELKGKSGVVKMEYVTPRGS